MIHSLFPHSRTGHQGTGESLTYQEGTSYVALGPSDGSTPVPGSPLSVRDPVLDLGDGSQPVSESSSFDGFLTLVSGRAD